MLFRPCNETMKSADGKNRLLGFGAGLVDLIAPISEKLFRDIGGTKGDAKEVSESVMADLLGVLPNSPERIPGGATANTLRAYAGLGGDCAMLSKLGRDSDGQFLQDNLLEHGVDISRFKYTSKAPTGSCLSLITPDSERTMWTIQGAYGRIAPDEFSVADFEGYSHFYIEGFSLYFPKTALQMMQLAKDAGLCICFDMGSSTIVRQNMALLEHLLSNYVDIVFANADEYCEFEKHSHGQKLSSICPICVRKEGAAGAHIFSNESGELHIPAVKTVVRDTTGAGDYWAAGFLYKWLGGGTLQEAGEAGARLAAAVLEIFGADLPLQKFCEIRAELK